MENKTFKIRGLTIITDGRGGGEIIGTLKELCPDCDSYDCKEDCTDPFTDYNNAMDGIESLLLAMGCAGMDLNDERLRIALCSAIEGVANNL